MKNPRRTSEALLPRSPLEFAHPLHVRGPGAEGAAILAELPPAHAATVLRLLRLVLAFSRGDGGAPVLRRDALERWEAEFHHVPDHPLWGPAITILAQLGAGERADAAMVAQSCVAVADWLLEEGAWQSALLFAEAAALAFPQNARMAWMAGRMLRNYGRMREAELWLRRAYRVATWIRDVETQDLALNSLGNLFAQQGCYKRALAILNRALKLAIRLPKGRRGCVSHDLLLVYIALGQHARAEEMAVSALRLYGPDHRKLPRLAFDVALLWSDQGKFQVALPILKALVAVHKTPVERLLVSGALARAAGACGDHPTFELVWDEIWKAARGQLPVTDGVLPAVLAELGTGAASLELWNRATEALRAAMCRAEEAGQYDVIARAESGLATVSRQERISPDHRPASAPISQLSNAFVRVLEEAIKRRTGR